MVVNNESIREEGSSANWHIDDTACRWDFEIFTVLWNLVKYNFLHKKEFVVEWELHNDRLKKQWRNVSVLSQKDRYYVVSIIDKNVYGAFDPLTYSKEVHIYKLVRRDVQHAGANIKKMYLLVVVRKQGKFRKIQFHFASSKVLIFYLFSSLSLSFCFLVISLTRRDQVNRPCIRYKQPNDFSQRRWVFESSATVSASCVCVRSWSVEGHTRHFIAHISWAIWAGRVN